VTTPDTRNDRRPVPRRRDRDRRDRAYFGTSAAISGATLPASLVAQLVALGSSPRAARAAQANTTTSLTV
jgi:hypothetical protein